MLASIDHGSESCCEERCNDQEAHGDIREAERVQWIQKITTKGQVFQRKYEKTALDREACGIRDCTTLYTANDCSLSRLYFAFKLRIGESNDRGLDPDSTIHVLWHHHSYQSSRCIAGRTTSLAFVL